MIHTFALPSKRRSSRLRIENAWFEYRLEHDPRFLKRIEEARANIQAKRRSPNRSFRVALDPARATATQRDCVLFK